jgi:type III secretory pathway component EscT
MEQHFLQIFLDSPYATGSPASFLLLFFIGLCRIFPILAITPFFGAKVLPHPVKAALGIAFFFLMLPHILVSSHQVLEVNLQLFTYGIKEILIGTVIGLISTVPFFIAQTAGVFIDHQRGGTSLMVNDPIIQNQDSPIGIMWNYILIVIFYAIDGPFIYISIMMESYSALPIDGFFSPLFFSESSPFWQQVAGTVGAVVRIGIKIAAPALLTILMTDVFLGIANRLAPQVMITFLGMPLKSLFGLGIITLGWFFLAHRLEVELLDWLATLRKLILTIGYGT